MKNVTITVDDAALEWARIEAAKRNTSVSRLVGEMLADKMRHDDAYARAMHEWMADTRHLSRPTARPIPRATKPMAGGRLDRPVFVDTNVLLYAEDARDAAKQRASAGVAAGALAGVAVGRLSTQVLNEFYVNATARSGSCPGRRAGQGAAVPALAALADRPPDGGNRVGRGGPLWAAAIGTHLSSPRPRNRGAPMC